MKWEYHYILLIKTNHCTNKLNNYINIIVKYSRNPDIIPYHYINKPYNIRYRPQKYHVHEFYNGNIPKLTTAVGRI